MRFSYLCSKFETLDEYIWTFIFKRCLNYIESWPGYCRIYKEVHTFSWIQRRQLMPSVQNVNSSPEICLFPTTLIISAEAKLHINQGVWLIFCPMKSNSISSLAIFVGVVCFSFSVTLYRKSLRSSEWADAQNVSLESCLKNDWLEFKFHLLLVFTLSSKKRHRRFGNYFRS